MPPTFVAPGSPGLLAPMSAGQVVGNTLVAFFVAFTMSIAIGILAAVAVGALLIPGSDGWDGLGYAALALLIGTLLTIGFYITISIVAARRRIPAGQRALPITALMVAPIAVPIAARIFVVEIWPRILHFAPF